MFSFLLVYYSRTSESNFRYHVNENEILKKKIQLIKMKIRKYEKNVV